MADDRLEGPVAEAFIAGAFALARDAAVSPAWFELSVRSLAAAYTERPLLPAPTLAVDLTVLLHGERLAPATHSVVGPLKDAVRVYEDHVLARLAGDRRWTRLTEAVGSAPRELRAPAVGMTVAQLLERLALSGGTGVSTGVIRRLATRPVDEVLETGRAALYDEPIAARLADGLTALARAARRSRELLTDAEVFLLENIAALKGLGPRVALAQLAEVAQLVEERLPARLRGQMVEDGDAPTQLEEDSAYPVGGFSSISTVGNLENLVTSELIYMEPGGSTAVRPDLFDVRFVESELLYYARDESVAVRRKRTVVIVFDASLVRARVLDRDGDRQGGFQRLVWLTGAVAALVRKLSAWLDTEALTFRLVFAASDSEAPLEEERNVLALVLREFQARGQLDFATAESAAQAIAAAHDELGSRGRAVLLTVKLPGGLDGPAQPDAIVDVSAPRPRLHWVDPTPEVSPGPEADAVSTWADFTRELLDGLLRRRRRSG